MGIRLWHQSSGGLENSDVYRQNIVRYTQKVLPGAQIDLHGLTYPKEGSPSGLRAGYYGEMLTEVQAAHNIVQAAAEGYDAFIYTCWNEPGLRQGRSMVDIPVVGIGETSLMIGQVLGDAIGLIAQSERGARTTVARTVEKNRFTDRVHCVVPITKPMVGGIHAYTDGGKSMIECFEDAARRAIALGADVLIAAEGSVSLQLANSGITEIDGVRVLDSFGASLQFANMLIELRKSTGVGASPSRKSNYMKLPCEDAQEVAECTADVLVNGWRSP